MNKILADSEEVKQGHLQDIKVNTITANNYVGSSADINIYASDGTLTGNRTVTTNDYSLTFAGTNNDVVIDDGDITDVKSISLLDGDDTNSITIQAPSTVTSSYALTLPVDDGNNGQVLQTNGSGALSWGNAGGGSNGYPDRIKLPPTMFIIDKDVDGTIQWDDSGSGGNGVKVSNATNEVYGTVSIPFGYKATGIFMATNGSLGISVFECDFGNTTATLVAVGSTGTLVTFSQVVNATNTNYLLIDINVTALTDRIRGGYITIEPI